MKAMALNYDGKARQVLLETPQCKSDQVLVRVQWSAIDTAADSVLQKTWTGTFVHKKIDPLILGWHFAGTVVETGSKVTAWNKLDKVWGHLQYEPGQKQGSFAEYIVVGEDECARQPDHVDSHILAAAATEAITAYQALYKLGGLESGQSVLIMGAGGGVGSAAVQIARNMGAHVTAVCSTKDVKRVKDFGAHVVIDRKINPSFLIELEKSYDVIFDTPNMYSISQCLRKLESRGTYVGTIPSWGLLSGMIRTMLSKKSCKFIGCHSNKDDLETIGHWLEEGRLKIDVDSKFPVKDLTKVVERQGAKNKNGRVVVQVEGGWQ